MDLQQMTQNQNYGPTGNPPVLGQENPMTANTSPAQGGLSVLANPLAQHLRSYGRGDDTMLVHMTPNEVNSLQGLAMATGGSLTINPHTGLPEAGWLGKLLPMILGGLGMAFGIPPIWMGLGGTAVGTAVTGSLQKGLMAGLGAFGGASLAGAAGVGGALGHVGSSLGLSGSGAAVMHPLTNMAVGANGVTIGGATGAGFGSAASTGLGGLAAKAAPMLAATGVLGGVSNAFKPSTGGVVPGSNRPDNSYQGPYTSQVRKPTFAGSTDELLSSSKERDYFPVDVPEIYNVRGDIVQPGTTTMPGTPILQNYLLQGTGKKKDQTPLYGYQYVPYLENQVDPTTAAATGMGMAEGGEVKLGDGAFVMDARSVSELGNGSSGAGQELLAQLGGRPVRGPGDGVSDSVPARIGRDQPARVARDEVIFDPEAVSRIGGGDTKQGAKKLYAMMEKAHKARKKAGRGTDTKLRRGLA